MMMKKLMMSCEDSRHICDKAQYNEASLWEKVKFKFHIFICAVCRQHSINNGKLTATINKLKSTKLTPSEKEEIKSNFDKELNNKQ
ncbi:hypothetical protein [Olleya sp. R77988]|uniref:hypothetical protein n=1 Tax=Olleya sp. R77988 TaxID=3093875 RepID=UPI0037C94B3F